MTDAHHTSHDTATSSQRVGAVGPALVAIACLAVCSLPLIGATFAAGLGAHLLGIPTWTYLVLAAVTIGAFIARARNRSSQTACGSCDC